MFKTSRQVIFKKYNYKVYERLFRGSFADIDATLLFFFFKWVSQDLHMGTFGL